MKDKTVIEGKILRVTDDQIEFDPIGAIPFDLVPRNDVEVIIYSDNTVVKINAIHKSNEVQKKAETNKLKHWHYKFIVWRCPDNRLFNNKNAFDDTEEHLIEDDVNNKKIYIRESGLYKAIVGEQLTSYNPTLSVGKIDFKVEIRIDNEIYNEHIVVDGFFKGWHDNIYTVPTSFRTIHTEFYTIKFNFTMDAAQQRLNSNYEFETIAP